MTTAEQRRAIRRAEKLCPPVRRPYKRTVKYARTGLHYRREGMVTICGVHLDTESERRARFTDDIGTLRRAKEACEACVRGML